MTEKSVKQKMAFYEINNGNLAVQMQTAFEEAQKQSLEHNEQAKVKLEIVIYPPDKSGKFGQVEFKIGKSFPSYKSMRSTTLLSPSTGLIINDGTSIADVMQESLAFKEPSIHELKKVDGE